MAHEEVWCWLMKKIVFTLWTLLSDRGQLSWPVKVWFGAVSVTSPWTCKVERPTWNWWRGGRGEPKTQRHSVWPINTTWKKRHLSLAMLCGLKDRTSHGRSAMHHSLFHCLSLMGNLCLLIHVLWQKKDVVIIFCFGWMVTCPCHLVQTFVMQTQAVGNTDRRVQEWAGLSW